MESKSRFSKIIWYDLLVKKGKQKEISLTKEQQILSFGEEYYENQDYLDNGSNILKQ